jgi:hypothetical protein
MKAMHRTDYRFFGELNAGGLKFYEEFPRCAFHLRDFTFFCDALHL